MSPKKKKLLTVVAALAVLVLGVIGVVQAWPDPNVSKARDIMAKMKNKDLSREDRRELFKQYGETAKELSPEQNRALREEMFAPMREEMNKRMEEFFQKPPEERIKAMDEIIDRGEERRKEWEARRAANPNGGRPGGGRPGGAGPPGASRGGPPRGGDASKGGGAPSKDGKGGPPGSGRGRRTLDPEKADQARKARLDRTTPEQRAMFNEFSRLMKERRKARGLPESRGFFGRGRGPR